MWDVVLLSCRREGRDAWSWSVCGGRCSSRRIGNCGRRDGIGVRVKVGVIEGVNVGMTVAVLVGVCVEVEVSCCGLEWSIGDGRGERFGGSGRGRLGQDDGRQSASRCKNAQSFSSGRSDRCNSGSRGDGIGVGSQLYRDPAQAITWQGGERDHQENQPSARAGGFDFKHDDG